MHIKAIYLSCALMALFAAGAARAEGDPTGFSCSFVEGTASTFDGGKFRSRQPEAITFTISNIDLDGQSARLMAEADKPPTALKIVRAINANHFLEVVNEGFLNLTTVYDKDAVSGTFPAVHSRHFGVLGQPLVAQYVGTCKEQ